MMKVALIASVPLRDGTGAKIPKGGKFAEHEKRAAQMVLEGSAKYPAAEKAEPEAKPAKD